MKNLRTIFQRVSFTLLLALTLLPSSALAQGVEVSGTVLDDQGNSVIGAHILVKDSTIGMVADLDGKFTMTVPSSESVLMVSMLGYATQEIVVGTRTNINIVLAGDNLKIDDVVVVAYGSQKKETLTGAVATVSTEDLLVTPVADVSNVLAGKMPGVTTVQTTGQPGKSSADIYIRGVGSLTSGASAPLVLVDGVEREFSSIDANEIESLTVLKDASSTAVFGVRGANGVILVTTRRGKVGAPQISFSSSIGVQVPTSYVEQASSYDYARMYNQKIDNDGGSSSTKFSDVALEAYRTGSDPIIFPNTNWGDMMFRDAFIQTQSNVNISGGSEDVRYFVSMGYLYQNGILKDMAGHDYDNNYSYNRYNYRSNLDFALTNTTTMKVNIGGSIGSTQEPGVYEDVSNPWTMVNLWSLPFSSPGLIDGVRSVVSTSSVPAAFTNMRDGYYTFYGMGYQNEYDVDLNMDVEITQDLSSWTDGLSVSAKGSYDNNFYLKKDRSLSYFGLESNTLYYKSQLEDSTLAMTDPLFDKTIVSVPTSGTEYIPLPYTESSNRDRNWSLEFRMNYARTFGDHAVSGLLLYTQSKDYYPIYGGDYLEYTYIPRSYSGYVGRLTYGYKNRYLMEVNAGYNGSENFESGKSRYGLFPSVSLGYVVTEEEFMKNQDVVSFLKIRASAGKVGNDSSSTRFLYMDGVWEESGSYYFGDNNSSGTDIYYLGTSGNTNVTWETSTKYNLGIDMNMFDGNLTFNADAFYEYRENILMLPNSTTNIIGTSMPNLNIGEVENKGYEVSVGWREIRPSGFSYSLNANASFARNKILFMDEIYTGYDYKNETGGSVGRFTDTYQYVRLYQESDFIDGVLNPELPQPYTSVYPGDAMYADMNGDGVVDDNDKTTTGYSTTPEYMFGLTGDFNYKGFNVSVQFSGATNVSRMMETDYRIPFTNAGTRGLLDYFVDNCWSAANPNAEYPRMSEYTESWNSENSTLWLRDATYFRLKTLSAGYTFTDAPALKKIGIKALSLKLSGYNLLTFSPLKFQDPEALASNDGDYPMVKTFDLGLNIKF
ncbi:MAG: TonB-dependent receptor [Rikenellaceae bacterium]